MTAMNSEIKKYADSGDLRSLKYVFVDALDVDPTFARYEEEYNYCKSIPGLLESHIELTPFHADPAAWTEDYWVELKMDLLKNFSDQRMTHMREVAKGLLEDKVRRILEERAAAQKQAAPPTQVPEGAFAAPAAEAQEAPQQRRLLARSLLSTRRTKRLLRGPWLRSRSASWSRHEKNWRCTTGRWRWSSSAEKRSAGKNMKQVLMSGTKHTAKGAVSSQKKRLGSRWRRQL